MLSSLANQVTTEVGPHVDAAQRWNAIVKKARELKATPQDFVELWQDCFSDWNADLKGPPPMWIPESRTMEASNVSRWMREGQSFSQFHRWTVQHRADFWAKVVSELNIQFSQQPTQILDLTCGVDQPGWLTDARLNIVESCFLADEDDTAVVAQSPGGPLRRIAYGELRKQTNRVSNSLVDLGFRVGDTIAVVLPMTAWSVPIYLGIIQAGCIVVSIADSFAAPEIASRIRISNAKLVFTYDQLTRAGKQLPLFNRVAEASDIPAVILKTTDTYQVDFRDQDHDWESFLSDRDVFEPMPSTPQETINILFSSGTTGDPKAIPWNHLTPIKCAADGFFHQDIHPGDVCVWPTNLGWMMGPWLIFASLMNRATIGLYEDVPMGPGFGQFIQDAKVNMLGVVPTIVKAWRKSRDMENFDWSSIHLFSSTGESSQRDDMVYLSSLADMKPVIEYCGGTEIGGGYVTSTVVQPNVPAAFSTPAVGLDFILVDETDEPSEEGEVYLLPPSIGLSNRLINRDHHEVYFAETPDISKYGLLRRHGDHFRRLPNGYFMAGGRVDDTMNLGGIKISSSELERVLNRVNGIRESAAVAISTEGGPARLVVFAVLDNDGQSETELLAAMNHEIRSNLNPLFKTSELQSVDALPRTASGKIMRRKLRDQMQS